MDPSRSAPHPFSRSQPQQAIPAPGLSRGLLPIPPSPYSTQPAAPRPEPLHVNDPFLRRRLDHDARQATSPTLNQSQTYAAPKPSQYPPNTLSDYPDPVTRDANGQQQGRQGSDVKYGNARGERYSSRLVEDPKQSSSSQTQLLHQNIPPPPNPPYAYRAYQMPKVEQIRRPKDNSQRTYDDHPPPPPPPPYSGRQMPPPSPPQASQAQIAPHSLISRGPPPPSPFATGRDNTLPSVNRPESSMSISSMLGSDAGRDRGRPPREPPSSVSFNNVSPLRGNARPPPAQQSGSVSSPLQISDGVALRYQRSQSPERTNPVLAQTARSSRAFSGVVSRRPFSITNRDSPDGPRLGSASGLFSSQYSPASENGSQHDLRASQDRRISTDRPLERPNSQPSGYRTPPLEFEHKLCSRPVTSEVDGPFNKKSSIREQNTATGIFDRRTQQSQEKPKSQLHSQDSPNQKLSNPSAYPFLNRAPSAPESQQPQIRPGTEPLPNRLLEREHSAPSQSPFSPESLRRLREERLAAGLHQQNLTLSPNNQPREVDQVNDQEGQTLSRNPSLIAPSIDNLSVAEGSDQPIRTGEDHLRNHRSSLALLVDNSRRGRVSPLPQAVQGAQGRISGPASDPGIKNEFSRMFMGIGAGVGRGGRLGSGTSSPFPSSPTKNLEPERRSPFARRGDLVELAKPRSASRGGKRGHKTKDEEVNLEPEAPEARPAVGTTNTRGLKRSRQSHHHHSHQYSHHHHHHRLDESAAQGTIPLSSSVHSKRIGTPSQAALNSGTAAGHHHHHHHHHHHNPKGSATPTIIPSRIPTTIINNKSVLDSVQKLPRHHLGSTLYRPWSDPNKVTGFLALRLSDPRAPNLIPPCHGKENCTFTIRVPRFYLKNAERREICRQRVLWGVDIYSDDSDPLAAAIHAGWICGNWGEEIDPSVFDPSRADTPKTEQGRPTARITSDSILLNPPAVPMQPIPGKDLHITILILPTLQSYASYTRYGIKSRPWGETHDGMSFMIEKIVWLDEGAGKGEERSGEARRKRMRNSAGWQGVTTGPPLRLNVIKKPSSGTNVAAVEA